jgi:hypothetical protein
MPRQPFWRRLPLVLRRLALALLLLTLLGQLNLLPAQQIGLGLQGGMAGAPTGIQVQQYLTPQHTLVYSAGHTQPFATGDNAPGLFQRGAFVLRTAWQPRWAVGSREWGSGFYGNLGAGLRTDNAVIHNKRERQAVSHQRASVNLEVFGGGGFFLRAGQTIAFFGGVNLRAGPRATDEVGTSVESHIGARYLLPN